MEAICSSNGFDMSSSISAGVAPGYAVITATTGKSIGGNKSTPNLFKEIIPKTIISITIHDINMGRFNENRAMFILHRRCFAFYIMFGL
jgi:hypothetical protein